MGAGASTPEELEMLLEDTLILRDRERLTALFDESAALAAGDGHPIRGRDAIARRALAIWQGDRAFVAQPRRVVQAGDIALIVGAYGVNVVRRDRDGAWYYAIVHWADGDRNERTTTMTQDSGLAQSVPPLAVAADHGEARWWFSSLAVIKATAADTGGQFSILEITEPPDMDGPLHVHHREDEGFWILEGNATIEIGDMTIEAKIGDYVFAPRDIPHRYCTGPAGCRMLFIMVPGGFEHLVNAMSQPADSRTLPPPSEEEPDWERVARIAKAHGCELLG